MNPGIILDNKTLCERDIDARRDGHKYHQNPADKVRKTRNQNKRGRNNETNYTQTNSYEETTENAI